MYAILVLAVSIAPALGFMLLILRMDRREPEPLGLVMRVVALGAASAVPAGLLEAALGRLPFLQGTGIGAAALSSFIQVAPVEEICKLAVVLLFVWRNPNFNEENDGIVYVGASAIGFALLENVGYVTRHGLGTGVLRAFSAVPLHVFTAVVMGLYVGRAKFAAGRIRRVLLILCGLALAWLIHGLYDTFASSKGGRGLLLPLTAGVVSFGILTLRKGRLLSLARWDAGPADTVRQSAVRTTAAAPAAAPPRTMRHHVPVWMAVIARLLLAGCLLFWVLLVVGVSTGGMDSAPALAVLGGIVITALPASLGIVLEHAYRRRRGQWNAMRQI
jgi:RsiW-degrading membrane proteinase PrsW (M82 family)